jgi:SulP family sulfate permease
MACLAGILTVVAYNMSEWRSFRALLRGQKSDVAVLVTTFLLTVFFDLTIAIEVGMLLAVVLFLRRINSVSGVSVIMDKLDLTGESDGGNDEVLELPKGVEVYEIDGPFFFGIANKFDESMRTIGDRAKVRIIRMRKVPFIDSTGVQNLLSLCRKSEKEGIRVVLSGVRPNVREVLATTPIPELLGEKNICPNIKTALARAGELLV